MPVAVYFSRNEGQKHPRAGGTLRGMFQAQDSVVALPSFLVLQPSTHTSEIFNRDNQHWFKRLTSQGPA